MVLKSSMFTSMKNSTRKKVQLKKKFDSKWPGNLPSKIKDALSRVLSFIHRSNCSGWRMHRFTENIADHARDWLHRMQIAFMSIVEGGAYYRMRKVLGCREERNDRGLQLIHVFS